MSTAPTASRFDGARQIADAVLLEGYVLYPYRASAAKNRMRWQFGVLAPPAWARDSGEPVLQRTEILAEPRPGATLTVEVRFLHAQRRTVEQALDDGQFVPAERLELPDRVLVAWDEAVEERVEVRVPVADLDRAGGGHVVAFHRPAAEETELVRDGGRVAGRLVRRRERVDGVLRLSTHEIPAPWTTVRLVAELENTTEHAAFTGREEALTRALVSAHVLLGLDGGKFLSMTDPPEWARPAAAECRNLHTWPVLAGEPGSADVVLSSPIILEDHPRVAPESPGALYDATEIDEILALRTATLTDQEKREARGTDARAGAVVDLAETLPPQVWDRLHGAIRQLQDITGGAAGPHDPAGQPDAGAPHHLSGLRDPGAPGGRAAPGDATLPWWDPAADAGFDPGSDHVVVGGRRVAAGSRVRLRPGRRRTDAQDIFLHGRDAVVEAVLHDVDGDVHLAVTVDGDPGADLRREQGRFLYFRPDEVTCADHAEDA